MFINNVSAKGNNPPRPATSLSLPQDLDKSIKKNKIVLKERSYSFCHLPAPKPKTPDEKLSDSEGKKEAKPLHKVRDLSPCCPDCHPDVEDPKKCTGRKSQGRKTPYRPKRHYQPPKIQNSSMPSYSVDKVNIVIPKLIPTRLPKREDRDGCRYSKSESKKDKESKCFKKRSKETVNCPKSNCGDSYSEASIASLHGVGLVPINSEESESQRKKKQKSKPNFLTAYGRLQLFRSTVRKNESKGDKKSNNSDTAGASSDSFRHMLRLHRAQESQWAEKYFVKIDEEQTKDKKPKHSTAKKPNKKDGAKSKPSLKIFRNGQPIHTISRKKANFKAPAPGKRYKASKAKPYSSLFLRKGSRKTSSKSSLRSKRRRMKIPAMLSRKNSKRTGAHAKCLEEHCYGNVMKKMSSSCSPKSKSKKAKSTDFLYSSNLCTTCQRKTNSVGSLLGIKEDKGGRLILDRIINIPWQQKEEKGSGDFVCQKRTCKTKSRNDLPEVHEATPIPNSVESSIHTPEPNLVKCESMESAGITEEIDKSELLDKVTFSPSAIPVTVESECDVLSCMKTEEIPLSPEALLPTPVSTPKSCCKDVPGNINLSNAETAAEEHHQHLNLSATDKVGEHIPKLPMNESNQSVQKGVTRKATKKRKVKKVKTESKVSKETAEEKMKDTGPSSKLNTLKSKRKSKEPEVKQVLIPSTLTHAA